MALLLAAPIKLEAKRIYGVDGISCIVVNRFFWKDNVIQDTLGSLLPEILFEIHKGELGLNAGVLDTFKFALNEFTFTYSIQFARAVDIVLERRAQRSLMNPTQR